MNTLSPLLGIDKSNPLLELLVNPEFPDEILVHYGMHLLEKVHRSADSIEGKLLAGRLYNAKLKRKKLVEIFGWDLKTIRGYAEALRSGDADRLRSVLSGQGAEIKIGEKEDRFIRETFREVREQQGCHTNLFIRRQLLLKLGVDVSRETIRRRINKEKERLERRAEVICEPCANDENTAPPLEHTTESAAGIPKQTASTIADVGENKDEKEIADIEPEQETRPGPRLAEENAFATSPPATPVDASSPSTTTEMSPALEVAGGESTNENGQAGQTKDEQAPESCPLNRENSCNSQQLPSMNASENSKHSPSFPEAPPILKANAAPRFLFHGGLSMALDRIFETADAIGADVADQTRQWLASILCGAVNIEQSSELDFDSLSVILGQKVLTDDTQRDYLRQHALTDAATRLRQANVTLIDAGFSDIFLYDPHGIKYTGSAKILRGWLGASHEIAKAYYQDFIHTLDGRPVVAFLDDNRDDLLRRFPRYVEQFRHLLSGDRSRPLTFVIDRAIYSIEDLRLYRDKHNIFVITWEKNCDNLQWEPKENDIGTFSFMKYRNHCNDTTTYRVEYYSGIWERDTSFTRYTVRIYKGKAECEKVLSVLCTDPVHADRIVLEPILRRWVQENNISSLISNVGINEITSYGKVDYAAIAETLEDRETANPAIRKLCAEKMNLRQKLGVELVKHTDRQRRLELEKQRLAAMEEKSAALATADADLEKEIKRCRASLKGKIKRFDKSAETLARRQKFYEEETARLEAELKTSPTTLLRLEQLIEGNYQKLNFGPKSVMDGVRLLAHNIFMELHEEFRPLYNNYRNDHRILRELLRSPVLISRRANRVNVEIIPTRRYEKKQRHRIESFLGKLNERASNSKRSSPFHFSIYELLSGNSICEI